MLFVAVLFPLLGKLVECTRVSETISETVSDDAVLQTDTDQQAILHQAAGLQQRQEAFRGKVLRKRYVLEEIMTPAGIPGKKFPQLAQYKDGKPSHLGKGSFGDAWKAFDIERQTTVAVKIFYNKATNTYIMPNTTDPFEQEDLKEQAKECRGTQALFFQQEKIEEPEKDWAEYLCRCFEEHIKCGEDGEPAFLVMEMCGENVENLVIKTNQTDVPLARKITQGVVRAIAYLYKLKPPMMHHDLKPENLCINKEGHVKLIDWGGLMPATSKSRYGDCLYTPAYEAPECKRSGATWKGKAWSYDTYAAGLIYAQLLCPVIKPSAWYWEAEDKLLYFNLKKQIEKECPDLDMDDIEEDIKLANQMMDSFSKRPDPWTANDKLQELLTK